MSDNITPEEISERERLLELQSNSQRWFSQEEFDRLKYLSSKMFQNSGSPHINPPPHTMSDKRLTAVSWLEERFEKYLAWQEGHHKATPYTLNELSNDFQQAKALEREQIKDAYINGMANAPTDGFIGKIDTPSEYFTKTYGDDTNTSDVSVQK